MRPGQLCPCACCAALSVPSSTCELPFGEDRVELRDAAAQLAYGCVVFQVAGQQLKTQIEQFFLCCSKLLFKLVRRELAQAAQFARLQVLHPPFPVAILSFESAA